MALRRPGGERETRANRTGAAAVGLRSEGRARREGGALRRPGGERETRANRRGAASPGLRSEGRATREGGALRRPGGERETRAVPRRAAAPGRRNRDGGGGRGRGSRAPARQRHPVHASAVPAATQQQTQREDRQQMPSAQQPAIAAALTELHTAYQMRVVVVQAERGFPAYGVLKAGDVITAVDGQPVTGQSSLTGLISAHPAGSTLTVTISRNAQTQQVRAGTVKGAGQRGGGHPGMGGRTQGQ